MAIRIGKWIRTSYFCLFFLSLQCVTYIGLCQKSVPERDDEVRAVIVLERHGVRAPIESEIRASSYNAQPWPSWAVAPGVLTQHGAEALRLLGEYYRARYTSLLQNVSCKNSGIYVEANTTQRTVASAKALLAGLDPSCPIEVHSGPEGKINPLFEPSNEGPLIQRHLADAIDGRMANQPDWFTNAFAVPLAKMHQVLMDCAGTDCDSTKPDFRSILAKGRIPSERSARAETPVTLGADFAEHFLLEYTEGMPMDKVGWGRVSRDDLNQLMEMNTRYHDFMLRTPYYTQVAASDLAEHLRDTILSLASEQPVKGQLGGPRARFIVLAGHDSNLTWLGGLLRLDWLLPDQTFNATPPGSALVFEVHHNRRTAANTIQIFFISQTLDQIRYLHKLNDSEQPSVAPVFVPGCSGPAPNDACTVEDFNNVLAAAIDPRFVESFYRRGPIQ